MIINPDKFSVIILDKKKSDVTNKQLVINNQQIKTISSVEHFKIQLHKINSTSIIISATLTGMLQNI